MIHPPETNAASRVQCFEASAIKAEDERLASQAWGDHQFWLRDNCWQLSGRPWSTEYDALTRRCLTPARTPSHQSSLFALGDSHGGMIAPALARAVRGQMAFAYTHRGMCYYASDQSIAAGRCGQDTAETARKYRDAVSAMLREQLQMGDVVSLSGEGSHHFRPEDLAWYESFLLPLLSSKGAKLLLIGDPPSLKSLPMVCIPTPTNPTAATRCESDYGQIYRKEGWGNQRDLEDAATEFAARHPQQVFLFRLFDLYCSSTASTGKCGAVVPGTRVQAYYDMRHLTLAGALYTWPFLCAAFRRWHFF
jgi:hypothetical protein